MASSPVAVTSAARVAFARALGLVQLPLTLDEGPEVALDVSLEDITMEEDNTITFIEE